MSLSKRNSNLNFILNDIILAAPQKSIKTLDTGIFGCIGIVEMYFINMHFEELHN